MLDNVRLLKMYWAFAVSVAVYFKNCTPTHTVVGKTLPESWDGPERKPSMKHHCVFKSLAFVHVPKEKQK